eukprot:TRINITY_DN1174_c0_g2_i2.p1 TRINITY_DN1174_c0_g2~~TRINITY_DN1174_c0_g2_i2.p1  ORF type:complete len:596 (-),score=144.23 TRINITY_DN1174_c0_g2_i2:145-1932(-)
MEEISSLKRKKPEKAQKNKQKDKASDVSPLQVCILGVPKHKTEQDIYKNVIVPVVDNPEESVIGIAKQAIKDSGFILFTSEASRKEFVVSFTQKLPSLKYSHARVTTYVAKPLPTSSFKSIARITKRSAKQHITEAKEILFDNAENQVLPWRDIPYREQVEKKVEVLKGVMGEFFEVLGKTQGVMPKCEYVRFIESGAEEIEGYRNKVELSIGFNSKGDIEIGFVRGKMEAHHIEIDSVIDYPHVSKEAKAASRIMLKVVKKYYESDQLKPYSKINIGITPDNEVQSEKELKEERKGVLDKGFWRLLQVRQSNKTKEIMLTVVCTKGMLTAELGTKLKTALKEAFPLDSKINELKIVSLNMIESEARGIDYDYTDTLETLHGTGYYTEQLLAYSFHVSPFSFLQVNTPACERMYVHIKHLALSSCRPSTEELILLDLYCGIGTIGICLEEIANTIVGVEVVPSAIEDAIRNAERNGIKDKSVYYCGKVEDIINQVAAKYENRPMVAIVDPPRAGLQKGVLKRIRTCRGLDVVVYVSCNQQSLARDALYLCQPSKGRIKGPAFTAVNYTGVDLFPYTPHTECVMLFKRYYPGSICT